MTFLDPTNDVAFRKVFADENHREVLISLLNALLGLSGEKEIQSVTILNPYQAPHLEGMKQTILDVQCVDQRGVTFIVEMQVAKHEAFDKRLQFYASRAYARQLTDGEDYPKLNQVIMLVFTGFNLNEDPGYLSRHLILNEKTGSHLLKDLEFFFVELPKFNKTEAELETLVDKWIYFFKNARRMETVPEPLKVQPIETALDSLQRFRWNNRELEYYENQGIYRQNEIGRMQAAVREAEERTKLETQRKIAQTLKQNGVPVEIISQSTGLTTEEIETF